MLAENRVSDPDLARLFIKDKISFDSDELFVNFDGEKLSFDNGIKKIFESKPNLLESSGNPGSGAGAGSGGDKPLKGNFGGSSEDMVAAVREMMKKG